MDDKNQFYIFTNVQTPSWSHGCQEMINRKNWNFWKKIEFQKISFFSQKIDFFKFYKFSIENLIINFEDFYMIQDAKLFFVIRWIQIEKIFDMCALLRALYYPENVKNRDFHDFELESPKFLRAQCVRKCARGKMFFKN